MDNACAVILISSCLLCFVRLQSFHRLRVLRVQVEELKIGTGARAVVLYLAADYPGPTEEERSVKRWGTCDDGFICRVRICRNLQSSCSR